MKLTFNFTRLANEDKGVFATFGDHTGQERVVVSSGDEILGAISDGFTEVLSRQISDLPQGVTATINVVISWNPPV